MTNKFSGTLWKWLLTNVMAKLTPSTENATEGQVLTVDNQGGMEWANPNTGRDVPACTASDVGKILSVKSNGYGWDTRTFRAWRVKLDTTTNTNSYVMLPTAVKTDILKALKAENSSSNGTLLISLELTANNDTYKAFGSFFKVQKGSTATSLNITMALYGYSDTSGFKKLGTFKAGLNFSPRIEFIKTLVPANTAIDGTMTISLISDYPDTPYIELT